MGVIVPLYVENAVNNKVKEFITANPDCAEDYDYLYTMLIEAWYMYGEIPDIGLSNEEQEHEHVTN
jgi:hypothetical protein